jgi:hypothetical protein
MYLKILEKQEQAKLVPLSYIWKVYCIKSYKLNKLLKKNGKNIAQRVYWYHYQTFQSESFINFKNIQQC